MNNLISALNHDINFLLLVCGSKFEELSCAYGIAYACYMRTGFGYVDALARFLPVVLVLTRRQMSIGTRGIQL